MARKNVNLSDVQFKSFSEPKDDPEQHVIEAYHPDFGMGQVPIGAMSWRVKPSTEPPKKMGTGEIDTVDVHPDYQKNGIATRMYHMSQQFDPPALHSRYQTAEGKSWAKKVGGLSIRDAGRNNPASGYGYGAG